LFDLLNIYLEISLYKIVYKIQYDFFMGTHLAPHVEFQKMMHISGFIFSTFDRIGRNFFAHLNIFSIIYKTAY